MRISVIIPTLNETAQIGDLIAATRAVGACEIVVVDGGSTDGTYDAAAAADRVIRSAAGRAVQQNTGAAQATGEVLLFLHADCRLPAGAFSSIELALADPRCIGGCFRQRIDAEGFLWRVLERGNDLRAGVFRSVYGDQGIFVRRETFEALGGFPQLRLMEDLYFARSMRKAGRMVMLPVRLVVSPRRWQSQGIIRQTLRNWALVTLAWCGVPPDRLARFYPHVR